MLPLLKKEMDNETGIDFSVMFFFILFFIVTAALYLTKGFFKWFYHDALEWHVPVDSIGFNGVSFCSKCKFCNRTIYQDSQGNWF